MSYNSCSEQRFDYSLARSIEANNDDREFFLPVFHMFDILWRVQDSSIPCKMFVQAFEQMVHGSLLEATSSS